MDLGTAAILVIVGVVLSLGVGWGVYEYNSRKAERLKRGGSSTPSPYIHEDGKTTTAHGEAMRKRDRELRE